MIDFKEIPKSNDATGEQDVFELFARELLNALGFIIVDGPDRGQDGGRDLIVIENRTGIIGSSEIRWLVSCKHNIHSGSAVKQDDEKDISDRLEAHKCNGFIGFYSTVVSAPLNRKLEGLKEKYEIQIFDREIIERILLENVVANKLIKRFFPKSYDEYEAKSPSNLLTQYMPLRCRVCGKDLLQRDVLDSYSGIVVFAYDYNYYKNNEAKSFYTDVYCVCKGECDSKMECLKAEENAITGWEDISDLVIPMRFLEFVMAIMNRLRDDEDIYTDEAYDNLKEIIISIAQITMKNQSMKDIQRIHDLSMIPKGI